MKKIIILDPDKKFHTLLNSVCNSEKVKMSFFNNGKDGIDAIADETPDLIILNLELEDMNGFLVCNMLKKNSLTNSIPIIITSLEKSEKDFEQHKKLKLRAEQYLKKPFSGDDLKIELKEYLGDNVFKKGKSDVVDDFTEENIDKLLDSTFLSPVTEENANNNVKSEESADFDFVDSIDKSIVKDDNKNKKNNEEQAFDLTSMEQESEISLDFSEDVDSPGEYEVLPLANDSQEMILPAESQIGSDDFILTEDEENEDAIWIEEEEKTDIKKEKKENDEPITHKFSENIEEKIKIEKEQLTVELDKLQKKTQELEGLNKSNKETLNSFKNENQDLSAELLSMEKQNEFLKSENKNLLLNIKSLQADIEEKVNKSDNEVAIMKDTMEKAVIEKDEAILKFDEINTKFKNLETDFATVLNEKTNLKQENEQIKIKLYSLENELKEKEEMLAKKEEEKLQETEKMFEDFKSKEENLKNQLEQTEKDKNDIQMQLLDQQRTLQDKIIELQTENNNQKEKIENLDSENNSVSEKLYEVETHFDKLKNEKAEKEKILLDSNANLTKNLMATEQELEKFKIKFNNLMKVINEE